MLQLLHTLKFAGEVPVQPELAHVHAVGTPGNGTLLAWLEPACGLPLLWLHFCISPQQDWHPSAPKTLPAGDSWG